MEFCGEIQSPSFFFQMIVHDTNKQLQMSTQVLFPYRLQMTMSCHGLKICLALLRSWQLEATIPLRYQEYLGNKNFKRQKSNIFPMENLTAGIYTFPQAWVYQLPITTTMLNYKICESLLLSQSTGLPSAAKLADLGHWHLLCSIPCSSFSGT